VAVSTLGAAVPGKAAAAKPGEVSGQLKPRVILWTFRARCLHITEDGDYYTLKRPGITVKLWRDKTKNRLCVVSSTSSKVHYCNTYNQALIVIAESFDREYK
jgi:hypothetical protein